MDNLKRGNQGDEWESPRRSKVGRMEEEERTSITQACQTEPVFVFPNKVELFNFARAMLLSTDRSSASSQTADSVTNRAVQATEEQRSRGTQCLSLSGNQTYPSGHPEFMRQVVGTINERFLELKSSLTGYLPGPHASLPVLLRQLPEFTRQMNPQMDNGVFPHCPRSMPPSMVSTTTSGLSFPSREPTHRDVICVDSDPVELTYDAGQKMAMDYTHSDMTDPSTERQRSAVLRQSRRLDKHTPIPLSARARLRPSQCIPNHRTVLLSCQKDVRETEPDEEFRVDPAMSEKLYGTSCSIGNYGWRLVCTLFTLDELRDRNYCGNRGKRAISPRRRHAIEHAYFDRFSEYQAPAALAEARNAINQGLRNMTHNCVDIESLLNQCQTSNGDSTTDLPPEDDESNSDSAYWLDDPLTAVVKPEAPDDSI